MENPLYDAMGDRRALPGTEAFAKWWRTELASLLKDSTIDVRRLQTELSLGQKYECWKLLKNSDGQPFRTFDEFCEAPEPHGCGVPSKVVKALLEVVHTKVEVAAITTRSEGAPEPKPPPGAGPGRGHKKPLDVTNGFSRGATTSYIASRIARDAPEIHERMMAGDFPSVRAAAMAAGIVKPEDPVTTATRALRKVPADRRHELLSADVRGLQMAIRRLTAEEQSQLYEWLGKELGR